MLWSLREPSGRGFGIDKGKLAESTNWAISQTDVQDSATKVRRTCYRPRSIGPERSYVERIGAMCDVVMMGQKKDRGSWEPGGQLPAQKRPPSETKQVSTMLCVAGPGLTRPAEPGGHRVSRQGSMWLKEPPPEPRPTTTVSSEWYATRLLIEKRFGDPAKDIEAVREKILAANSSRRQAGFSWTRATRSVPAYGHALSQVGITKSHPAIQKAWRFLIETQTAMALDRERYEERHQG